MNLSDNLKKIRKEHSLSQEQLAEKLGVSRQSVSKWESGQAYPEMDKMVQLCKIFNLNIDDLLNQDIKEVNNNKQSKNNINKFIDDFLIFITKTIDMFSCMNLKTKIKCVFEQFIIIIILILIYLIIGMIGSNIISSLFAFMPASIYYSLYNILEAIYLTICVILTVILLFHIFKVRYLDYYVIDKEESIIDVESSLQEDKKENEVKKLSENQKEKIIIRDPNHSEYKFISGLLKCLLFIIKTIAAFIAFTFCLALICLAICFIISFLFIKTGILFIGTLITIIALIIITLVILIIIYNFIISRKSKKSKLAISFIISLIMIGFGIGLISIGITDFKLIDTVDNENFIHSETTLEMDDNLFFENYYDAIEYVESENKDIKIVYKHSKYYNIEMIEEDNGYYFYLNSDYPDKMEISKKIIKDINNKEIVNYSTYKVYIYTTKENINILKSNLKKYRNQQEEIRFQEQINNYEKQINNLELQIEKQNDLINELETQCDYLNE